MIAARAWAPARRIGRLYRQYPILVVPTLLAFLALLGFFTPAYAADPEGPAPAGFGDLLRGPELNTGDYKPTLYEAYPITAYYFDTNRLGPTDAIHVTINALASVVMLLCAAIVRGAIVLVWTLFDDSSTSALAETITPNIAATASTLMSWMLPSALALGAVIAYAKSRGTSGGGLGQVAWLVAGGVLAVSFATSPSLWVNTMTSLRTVTSDSVLSAASTAVATTDTPFDYPDATYGPVARDKMLRDSADGIWRAYVVTPWCLAEFGSQEACTLYGKALLDQGVNPSTRSDWIQNGAEGHPGEWNDDGDTFRWIAGKNSYERLGMALVSMIVALIFAVLVFVIAFAAQIAFYGALLMLFVGCLFVMFWCIPGRPRAWANAWLDTVVGLLIQSVVGALVLAATLTLTAAALQLAGEKGWGVAAGMSIGVSIAAFTMRRTIGTILGAMTPGMGMTTVIGALAMRSTTRVLGKIGGRAGALAGGARRGKGAPGAPSRGAVKPSGRDQGTGRGRGDFAGRNTNRPLNARGTTPTRERDGVARGKADTTGKAGVPGDARSSSAAPPPRAARRGVGRPALRDNPPAPRRSSSTSSTTAAAARPARPRTEASKPRADREPTQPRPVRPATVAGRRGGPSRPRQPQARPSAPRPNPPSTNRRREP